MKRVLKRFAIKARVVLFGHLLNPLWLSHLNRRRIRSRASAAAVMAYLEDYGEFASSLECRDCRLADGDGERRIFSIWLQGEENAPSIVKACWRSVRTNCSEPLTVIDENTLGEYIQLPKYIMDKWRSGRMKPAHFTDICRVALLCRYGGLWLDATDFVTGEFPSWLWEEDFFVYLSGDRQRGCHSFVQNCFIRAKSSSFLITAWRDMIFEYWRRENSAADYFIHQLLFRFLIENDDKAASEFAKMRKICQDDTHVMWFENAAMPYDAAEFGEMCSRAMFQKTEYKSKTAAQPPLGSIAEAVINMYL